MMESSVVFPLPEGPHHQHHLAATRAQVHAGKRHGAPCAFNVLLGHAPDCDRIGHFSGQFTVRSSQLRRP